MKKAEELIWDYLDGLCSPEDQAHIEERLANDEDFRALYLRSRALQQNLQQLEVEMPSMRFSQNIMEKLPAVKDLAVVPLVSKKWLQVFGASIIAVIGLMLSSSLAVAPNGAVKLYGKGEIFDPVISIFNSLSTNTLVLAGIIGLALLCLLFLDRWLQTRFLKNRI